MVSEIIAGEFLIGIGNMIMFISGVILIYLIIKCAYIILQLIDEIKYKF